MSRDPDDERKWYLALRINHKTREILAGHTITDTNPTRADGVMAIPVLANPMTLKEAKAELASAWWAWIGPLSDEGHTRMRLRTDTRRKK